jgi:hypothetical protein
MAVMAMIISQPAAVEASVSFFAFQKLINLWIYLQSASRNSVEILAKLAEIRVLTAWT